jgi:hypothetical protein
MAHGDTFTPRGAADEIKIRGPVWVGVWSFVTLGIYAIYWIYVTAKHLKDYGNARGQDLGQKPGMTLLALTLGWILLFIPPIVALFRQGKRIQQAQQLAGVQPMNGWLALVLYLVLSPVFFAYEQSELNKAWGAEGGPVPTPDGGVHQPQQAQSLPPAPDSPLATTTTPATETQPVSSPERPGA